jgi:mannose-6-phosphate isomerase-like protein (cupin superfamily)
MLPEGLAETVYLDGHASTWTLPVFNAPPKNAPGLKRLLLPQGELAQFHDGAEGMRYLAFVELVADAVRGNHYHLHKPEWIYVIRGALTLTLESIATKSRVNVEMRTGDLAFIHTGVAHALRTRESGQAVEFSPVPFDAADVFRYPLL